MRAEDLSQREIEQLGGICGFLSNFLDKGVWAPANPLEDLVLRTLARGRGTFATIVDLVAIDRPLQAAMLGRSLFEDMVVAHWLVLHKEDPHWLVQRFDGHRDAMRLYDARMREQANWLPSGDDVSDLAPRDEELRSEYGTHAERDWWGQDRDGRRITMPQLVKALAAERRFQPRLRGEQPILEQYYALQQKAWTQALHHTAAGMNVRPGDAGRVPVAVPGSTPFLILFGNYWVFGQLVFVALELGASPSAVAHFEELFLTGLAVFGELVGAPAPWAQDVAGWADAE